MLVFPAWLRHLVSSLPARQWHLGVIIVGEALAYWVYFAAFLGAIGIYSGMPREGRRDRRLHAFLAVALVLIGLYVLLDRMAGEAGTSVTFAALALLGVGSAARVVTHPRPVYSALYFIMVILSTSALIIHVGAEFLGIALVIVYAGAILVTYVFVIMLAQQPGDTQGRFGSILDYDRNPREPGWAVVAGFLLMAIVARMIVTRDWPEVTGPEAAGDNTLELGRILMTRFAISVELAAVLLMVAMVGAIAVARKRIPRADDGIERAAPGEIGRTAEPF